MKKQMLVFSACILASVATAADLLPGVEVYDFKASVKHAYLKEKEVKKVDDRGDVITKMTFGKSVKFNVKYTKSSSFGGYLIQDMAGVLGRTDVGGSAVDASGYPVRAITRRDKQPGNRCFLVVQNKSAEKAYRIPRLIPGVLEAKWHDTELKGKGTIAAQGYLRLGGEVVARSGFVSGCEGHADDYSGFRGTTFAADRDFCEGSTYSNEFSEAFVDGSGPHYGQGRMFWDQQRDPLRFDTWDEMTNCPPWLVGDNTRTCDFGIDDYFFTSCYLFGKLNQPTRYDDNAIQEFADFWMNGAGIGNCDHSRADHVWLLKSLSGNLMAGLYLCVENGEDVEHELDFRRMGLFEDQFWQGIVANSYGKISLRDDDFGCAWYRREEREDDDYSSRFLPKQDIWALGDLDLRTTDVAYGTWSIKRNDKLASGFQASDAVFDDIGKPPVGFSVPADTLPLMRAIKLAQYKFDKTVKLFGDPTSDPQSGMGGNGMINFSFYWNYLAEGYGEGWVNPFTGATRVVE